MAAARRRDGRRGGVAALSGGRFRPTHALLCHPPTASLSARRPYPGRPRKRMTEPAPSPDLAAQEAALVFAAFDEDSAWGLGETLVRIARAKAAPVVIDIRTPDRTLFHAALPGSAPENDDWARRKSNVVFRCHRSSLRVGEALRAKGETIGPHLGMDPMDFAAHGGSVPVRVAGIGVVAAATVSGLPQRDDHAMVVEAMADWLAASKGAKISG
jgi:uncharacterized protein (UPF0303 family)